MRDFRGWLWQEGRASSRRAGTDLLPRRSFFSIRLPVEVFRDALIAQSPQWPPADLDRMTLRLRAACARATRSRCSTATRPARRCRSRSPTCSALLLPGETLTRAARRRARGRCCELTGARRDDAADLAVDRRS